MTPVPGAYENLNEDATGIRVDTIFYAVTPLRILDDNLVLVGGAAPLPGIGTAYIAAFPPDSTIPDTIGSPEPIQMVLPDVVRISVRRGDSYVDILEETLGTPFLMMPRTTPRGFHQAEDGMGYDCAGLAVYGARRMGMDVAYLGPEGILRYLEPVAGGQFFPEAGESLWVYRNGDGESVAIGDEGLRRGDILHLRCQVSVFFEDRGIVGVLDSRDLVIQSWFDGTSICTLEENGFFGLPLRPMRWTEIPRE
jgi:hypothetical protein